MLDWLIVGGGIHGVCCASFLRSCDIKSNKLSIIDPYPKLLSAWKKSTESVRVSQLRSTHVHHLAKNPFSLIKFSSTKEEKKLGKLRGKYGHPDLELFNAHSDRVIEKLSLQKSHIQGRVTNIENNNGDYWKVEQSNGSKLYSKNLVLALGCDNSYPKWYKGDLLNDERIQLSFEAKNIFLEKDQKILIVGSGMSGVQIALNYAVKYPGKVTLVSRKPPIKSLFDSEPGWIGPKYQNAFRKILSDKKRREKIKNARFSGSVPPRLMVTYRKLIRDKSLSFIEGSLEGIISSKKVLKAFISSNDFNNCNEFKFNHIVLSTGFSSDCPQKDLIKKISDKHKLPLSACNFPLTESISHWGKGLHLSGALAELKVGPVARNIVGARIAGESLVRSR